MTSPDVPARRTPTSRALTRWMTLVAGLILLATGLFALTIDGSGIWILVLAAALLNVHVVMALSASSG